MMGPMGPGMSGPPAVDMYGKVVNGGFSLIHGMESSVHAFGRISHLLQLNFEVSM